MKDHHLNVFWSDEDDCYVADLPDFEYCSAFGDTPEEALAEVLIAKKGWIETAIPAGSISARQSASRLTADGQARSPPPAFPET